MRFDRNDYSVPTAYAHQDVVVIGGIESIKIVAQGHLVATHTRSWDKAQTFYEPVHYLSLLERKPGAFDAARPLEDWQLPACFWSLRRRLEVDMGPTGVKEYIKVLRLLERSLNARSAHRGRTSRGDAERERRRRRAPHSGQERDAGRAVQSRRTRALEESFTSSRPTSPPTPR